MGDRDPIEAHADSTRDLYDISTWEPRSALDAFAVRVYRGVLAVTRAVVILLAVLILLSQFLLGSIGVTFARNPYSVGLVVLSVVPAVALATYVYVSDVTSSEPLKLVVGTFLLGILFAGFAAILNTVLAPIVRGIPSAFGLIGSFVGMLLFFYLVVGPVEESVKLLAVRLYAYRDDSFDAVIDGAVYGAVAGLGFATIENALYITRNLGTGGNELALGAALGAAGLGWVATLLADLSPPVAQSGASGIIGIVETGGRITALRALAGPGHVIYSAFAGYYLGLAKFNRENAGPIVVKGLLIAALIHSTYNVLVGIGPAVFAVAASQFLGVSVPDLVAFFAFVVVYDGIFGYALYRKIATYRAAYREVQGTEDREGSFAPEVTEFDP
ncbi:MAG: PrsW family intramembrane metalloprotease [Haloglomus sp.]